MFRHLQKLSEHISELVSETERKLPLLLLTDVITPNCSPINPPDPAGMSELSDTLIKIVRKRSGYGEATSKEAAQEYYNKGIELWGE